MDAVWLVMIVLSAAIMWLASDVVALRRRVERLENKIDNAGSWPE